MRIANVTFGCANALTIAGVLAVAIERPLGGDPNEFFTSIGMRDDAVPALYFAKVPEDPPRTQPSGRGR